jgi:two-component system, chemotaxis family, protein-glutamate methylesterase/glutaminase
MSLLNVLVLDDESIWRRKIQEVLSNILEVANIETAANLNIAKAKLKNDSFDLIFVDINIQDENLANFLKHIKKTNPNLESIAICDSHENDSSIIIEALGNGALSHIAKYENNVMVSSHALLKELKIPLSIIQSRKYLKPSGKIEITKIKDAPDTQPQPITIEPTKITNKIAIFNALALGVSTGGPNALLQVIPNLPNNLDVPIFLVQHMPAFLTASLAENLNSKSKLEVKEAIDNEIVNKNVVYIAPGGKHMAIEASLDNPLNKIVRILDTPPENFVKPAVDVLFRSLAKVYKGNILSVIMTGMGSDGLKGVESIKRNGGRCLTQSQETCVVYGMPKAVDDAGLSDEQIPIDDIASRITRLIIK